MNDRILALLSQKGLTPGQFADEIGIQRSGMSHILSGRNKPSLDFIMKVVSRFTDVRTDWLLFGDEGSRAGQPGGSSEIIADSPTLFDLPAHEMQKPAEKLPRAVQQVKAGRSVERIVVFYDDRSFREYYPEK